MRRREFIAGLGATASPGLWPRAARAQPFPTPVVGFLGTESRELWAYRLRAFHQGLNEAGYVEGRNVMVEYRFVDDEKRDLPALAADLVARKMAVIAAFGGPRPALAAKAVSGTIPIVFTTSSDPVEIGLVASLAHPGGNLTGATTLNSEVAAKRRELLHETVPTATTFALLVNPNVINRVPGDLQEAARTLGLRLHVLHAGTDSEIDDAFAALRQVGAGGLVIGVDSFVISRSDKLAALALRHGVPAIFLYREFAAAGGLMSYGGSSVEAYRLSGIYTGRILRGEKPADLPVQQSTKVELVINLKTAKALGITFPLTLLGRADEVIE
jgi:putative tryptophan/tyrosine transport system substrate-binding protein